MEQKSQEKRSCSQCQAYSAVQQTHTEHIFLCQILNLFFLKFSLFSCKNTSFQWRSVKSVQFPFTVFSGTRSLRVPSGSPQKRVGACGCPREGGCRGCTQSRCLPATQLLGNEGVSPETGIIVQAATEKGLRTGKGIKGKSPA